MSVDSWRLLRAVLAVVALSSINAMPAHAARPDLRQMTCDEARDMVRRSGAVVATTGRYTYQRFVSHQRYCDRWEEIVPEHATTRDNPQCFVGYRCEEPLFRRFWD